MNEEEFGRRLVLVASSVVFGLVTMVLGLVLRLMWSQKHRPVIGFLWLFLFAIFLGQGVATVILIGTATELLLPDSVALQGLGLLWFGTQFCSMIPAVGLGLFVLQVIDERWIVWLFRPPVDKGQGKSTEEN